MYQFLYQFRYHQAVVPPARAGGFDLQGVGASGVVCCPTVRW